ncbi:Heparan-sulfate 6-O-sulfotransferase 1-A [Bagarius yarrelli]|uniref:Heparan-sulfate 6-O-sulfotransferase n=1 Tax=Bagarius yarrelli TaxID=175774 RepID=A0A556V303_BAGYA|nr:Heparan-sulfate 6-O-sulfotransferase 1-A [Bagarius yarrelli]
MVERSGKFLFAVVGSALFMLILYQYAAPGAVTSNFGLPRAYAPDDDDADTFPTPDPHYVKKFYFPARDLERAVDFQIKGDDVLVFLHIQKTGGTTFGRHLVQNVRLELPCDCRPGQKKCTCYRPNRKETWLFSRFSTGWSCGLHADWTELTNCVPGFGTFHLKFIRPFVQYNSTRAAGVDLDNDTIQRIEELNELDVQLYDYARDLFQQRYMFKRQLERHEQRLKNLRHSSGSIASSMSRDEAGESESSRLSTEDYMNHIINRWKFYYITLLRDPVSRYLSEWRHVQRGATWKTSLHMCDGRTPTPEELPPCYEGTDWSGCTLQQFMECPYNLANNRQVRMLADLSLVGCYNMSFIPEKNRAQILLESAKKNLRDMAFFGLTEFQRKTQYLFERTFHLKFIRPFVQYNSTRAAGVDLDNDTIQRIEELNELDVQLYDYARDLFQQRYMFKRQLERHEQRLKNLRRSSGSIASSMSRDEAGESESSRLSTEDYMNHIINRW